MTTPPKDSKFVLPQAVRRILPEAKVEPPAPPPPPLFPGVSAEDKAKGFVRPYRKSYIHGTCGKIAHFTKGIAEAYAKNPKHTSTISCATCGEFRPTNEFTWAGTVERVGS